MTKSTKPEISSQSEVETIIDSPDKVETTIPVQERDEFAAPEYLDPDAKLPRIQALRGTTPKMCGYFVAVNQMAAAGWINFDESELITYTYESTGNEEQGLLIQNPRMLVCPKSPVLGFDKEQSKQLNSTMILGRRTPEMKKDKNIGNLQYFQVFLLDQSNQPLHQIPLLYKAIGTNQVSFSIHWQEFCRELGSCHSIINGMPAKPKNAKFCSLGVFSFKTARELVGDKDKGFACRVVEHEKPTTENWHNYFLGFNGTVKEYVWESLEPTKPLMVPGSPETLALPAATENETVAITTSNS